MATSTIRPRISIETIPSFNVTANALRLVLAGYLPKLRFNVE